MSERAIHGIPLVLLAALALTVLSLPTGAAPVAAKDDTGHTITLAAPAQRIVSLAPHATELLYAAGAGEHVIGVVEYSNYPAQARRLPSVGSAAAFDMERIVALKPDLVIAWSSGNSAAQVARLRSLGMTIFESEPRDFSLLASNIERLAHLAGTDQTGKNAAAAFRARQSRIEGRYRQRPPVRVFYQIWHEPLMTLNDSHMASAIIRMCGGVNIFGNLTQLAPTVGVEDVVQADPEAIIGYSDETEKTPTSWRRFPKMTAVARNNLFAINPDWMSRPGPRILDGAEALCTHLETVRAKRK